MLLLWLSLLVSCQTVQSLTVSPACLLLSPQPSTARRQMFFSCQDTQHIMELGSLEYAGMQVRSRASRGSWGHSVTWGPFLAR